jgi:hypothetical protein
MGEDYEKKQLEIDNAVSHYHCDDCSSIELRSI